MSDRPAGGPAITERAVYPEDDPFLFALYQESRAEEVAAWGWDPLQREQFLRMQYAAQRRHYRAVFPALEERIIQLDGIAVGRLCVARSDHEIRLVDITLLDEVRRRGIGAALIGTLQAQAAAAGKPLRLNVLLANPALRLYRRLEFVPRGDDGVYLNMEWRATAGAARACARETTAPRSAR